MKQILLMIAVVALVGCVSQDVGKLKIGMTEADVISLFGKPFKIRDNGVQRTLEFRNEWNSQHSFALLEGNRVISFGSGYAPDIDPNPRNIANRNKTWDDAVNSGVYTYEIAIKGFGPPTQEKTLEDGTKVCVWRSSPRGSSLQFPDSPLQLNNSFVDILQLTFSKTQRGLFGFKSHRSGNLEIVGVTKNGAAEKAGMRVGDIILSVKEKAVNKIPDLNEFQAGEKVKVVVKRGAEEVTLNVTLGEFPLVLTSWSTRRN
jgi:hypothetical protein